MKILKRLILSLFIIFAALVLILFLSIGIDALLGRGRLQEVTNITIPGYEGGPAVRAYAVIPQGTGPYPVVIMIHEFYGINESIIGKAEGLAEEGYYVIAPDTFRGSTTSWIPRAIFQVISTPSEQINQDLDAVFAWLSQQPEVDPERIAVLGFCYGGRASLSYSLHNPGTAATVIFYGSPETDPQVLQRLTGPVLGIFGESDSSIPLEQVRAFETALTQAGVPNEISIYPGQPHAFVTDIHSIRQGGVQGQAWDQMLGFLEQNLQGSPQGSLEQERTGYAATLDLGYYFRLVFEHTFYPAKH